MPMNYRKSKFSNEYWVPTKMNSWKLYWSHSRRTAITKLQLHHLRHLQLYMTTSSIHPSIQPLTLRPTSINDVVQCVVCMRPTIRCVKRCGVVIAVKWKLLWLSFDVFINFSDDNLDVTSPPRTHDDDDDVVRTNTYTRIHWGVVRCGHILYMKYSTVCALHINRLCACSTRKGHHFLMVIKWLVLWYGHPK